MERVRIAYSSCKQGTETSGGVKAFVYLDKVGNQ